MRNWLELSDLALAQKIDYTEKNGAETDPTLAGFVPVRAQESCDHLNRANGYRALTGETTALLDRTMEGLAPQIEQALGHPFRIVSVRSFELQPRTGIEGRRTARWDPPASGNAIAREGPTSFSSRGARPSAIHGQPRSHQERERKTAWRCHRLSAADAPETRRRCSMKAPDRSG